jgi:hypothetical protein
VALKVLVAADGRSEERFSAVLDPLKAAGVWHDASLSLADLSGRRISIRLETLSAAGAEPWLGVVFWGHPEILELATPPSGQGSARGSQE